MKKKIVIVIGQSNGVSAYVGAVPSPYDTGARGDIELAYYLEATSGGTTESTAAGVTTAMDITAVNSWWSLDLPMSHRLVDTHDWINPLIVRVCTGSTDLATDWAAGGTLMDRVYNHVKDLVDTYTTNEWEIVGIVRMQGESDSNDVTDSANFAANLTAHYAELRKRFNENYSTLPIIECEIKKTPNLSGGTLENINTVRAAQASVCGADRYCTLVETQDLTQVSATYPVHFDEAGMVTLGERVADALTALVSTNPEIVDPTITNLVSHYKLDVALVTVDDGSNASDLTNVSTTIATTAYGKINGAAIYPVAGTGYLRDLGYSNTFHHTDFTMMGWAKFDASVIGSATSCALFSQWTSGTNRNFLFYKQGTSDSVAYNCRTSVNQYPVIGNTACLANTWYHFAVKMEGGVITVFQDGIKQVDSNTPVGVFNSGSVDMQVGNMNGSNFMRGELDDLRVYDRALTDGEIKWIYQDA